MKSKACHNTGFQMPPGQKRNGFRQRAPPVLKYLQGILRKYPDGGQILKELIQNADDAGAEEVILLYDDRKFGKQNLFSEGLASAQGPALLAYNTSQFSEDDWEGIQSPGVSHKEDDPLTVGRFGLGFSSVYHITDFPSILSGQCLGVLDPQEAALSEGGQLCSVDEWEEASDQFEPFWAVLKSLGKPCPATEGHFPGTLFRFPLRQSPSKISENVYSPKRVKELLFTFLNDAPISLLFLRNIRKVTLGLIESNGTIRELLRAEATIYPIVNSEVSSGLPPDIVLHVSDFPDDVTATKLDMVAHIKTLALCGTGIGQATNCHWLVLSAEAKKDAFPELWDLSTKVCSRPAQCLAYCLQDKCPGRLSCVLPLPATEENMTGLPLHISAPFQLTDDRRHVQWSEEGSHARGADGRWNYLLLEEMLPLVYCQMVLLAAGYPSDPYGAWPDPDESQQLRYKPLVAQICQRLLDMQLLVQAGGGNPHLLYPREAVLLPEKVTHEPAAVVLEKALVSAGSLVAAAPPHVRRALSLGTNDGPAVREATAQFVRKTLRHSEGTWCRLSVSEKHLLLEYLTGDEHYQELEGLPLLPTASGHFTCFGGSGETVFVENHHFPRILLPGLAQQFLPKDLNPKLLKHLQAIAEKMIFGNLVSLDRSVIEQNLRRSLPTDWVSSSSGHVAWRPQKYPQQPPLEWLDAFWNFLKHHTHSLAPFNGCPLIPLAPLHESLSGIQLARLVPQTTLLFQSHDGRSLPGDVGSILETLGCSVIQGWKPGWVHHELRKYILEPTPCGVLQAFAHLGVASVAGHLASLSTSQIESLSTFLSTSPSLSQKELDTLKELPLFVKMPSLLPPARPGLVAAQCHLALEKSLVPPVPTDLLTPEPVLLCRNEAERRLLVQIRGSLLEAPDLCLLCVKAMKKGAYVNQTQKARQLMLWVLRNGNSLFSQNLELKTVCCNLPFLDCGSGTLRLPSELYDPDNPTLRALLKPCCFPVGPFQEPQALQTLRKLGLKSDLGAVSPADLLTAAEEVNELQETTTASAKSQALIQVCNETPLLSRFSSQALEQLRCLSWVPATNSSMLLAAEHFLAPESLRSEKYAPLVGLVMGLTNAFCPAAAEKLGLECLPPPEKVMENLMCLVRDYRLYETLVLTSKLNSIYQHMQEHLRDFRKPPASPAVWNGNGFSSPSDVVLTSPDGLDLGGLMSQVPPNFQRYSQLFAQWGVRQSPTEEEVCQALHKFADQINSQPQGGTQAELLLVIAVLDWLRDCGHRGEQEMPVPVRILGLAGFALRPASSVLYCDMDRTRLDELDGDPPTLVHESVSSATAAFFGVEMLSTQLSGLELFEAWGPSEPITLRIRNILREYSQDADVFLELLQNAEDAGAQTCRFLVDLRQHSGATEGLLDPGMAACHGPALWAQNDALFSDADFLNITRLGAATKERQGNKIGRFGLGFCTVYHVTDVPSLLSGRTVLIFDPNITHLRKHIHGQARPGIRLKLTQQVATAFPEQFRPFTGIFGCQAGEAYQGTLIRLPFRTEQEAKDSQISSKPFTSKRIGALQTGFQQVYQSLLIFLRSVQEVSLAHLPSGSCFPEDAQPLATVCRQTLDEMGAPSIVRLTATWESDVRTSHYLLHSCSAKGEAQELFKQGGGEGVHFSPPVAGVALPLCPASTAGRWTPALDDFKGHVFCSLPLPIETGLPLHLTAAFAVLSNRKGLWDATRKGQWNRALLRDSALQAWLGALSRLRDMDREGLLENYQYYIFWPDLHNAKYPFSETAKAFYQALVDGVDGEQPVLFSDGQRWCPARDACILDADIIAEKQLSPIAARVFSSLLPEPQIAVSLPNWVEMSFKECIKSDELRPKTYNWVRFLQELVLPNLALLAVPDRDTLVLHALDMKDARVDEILTSLPCIPTTPHKALKNIKELIHPKGRVAPLYTPEDGHFPMGDGFLEPERLLRLTCLGMAQNRVAVEKLIDRARTVAALWHHDQYKACQRAHHILALLEDHLQESLSNTVQVIFREIPFLPAVLPGNCHKLCCPSEIYHHKMFPLVGLIEPVLEKDKGLKLSKELKEFLGLNRQPPVATVLGQLEAASLSSNALSREELAQIAPKCYAFLDEMVKKHPQCRREVSQRAQAFPFVLVGTRFVPVCLVDRNLAFDGAPYLYRLPEEYQHLQELWKCVGLLNVFEVRNYTAVLQKLAMERAEQALSKEQLELVNRLITVGMAGVLPKDQVLDPYEAQNIFFPDRDQVLRPLPKLLFDDTPWLPRKNGALFCHPMIPREIALCCGIPTTKHHLLSRQRIQGLSPWATEFGAKEDLCTRVANILRDYSSSQDVLKELLQNADDAGAGVVHFLWDLRQHPTERTFSEEWNHLQGPALCIYNDQTFQLKDIEGIQRLGCGGKGKRQDATGKYGLGFNTVFHLTDCPAFVTGDSLLCVFDPTLRYLPDSHEASPGAKYSLTKDFKSTFPDVYDAFLPDVFDLEHGTVFRLPLRTPAGAAASPICQNAVSEEDMKRLIQTLVEDADCLVMFLNHVRSLVFSVIKKGEPPKEILRVETEGGESERLEYQKHLQKAAAAGGMDEGKPRRVFYKMKVNNNSAEAPRNWLVGRQIGVESTAMRQSMLLPHGGVAACLTEQRRGRAFCTLPLPVQTGLPIHVNGNFAVDSGRRDLRKDSSEGSTDAAWNDSLLRCLVAPLYCQLLEELRQALGGAPLEFSSMRKCQERLHQNYLRYFPLVTEDVAPHWQRLVTRVYELAYEGHVPLVPVYQKQIKYVLPCRVETVSVCWSAPKLGHPARDPYFWESEIDDCLEGTLQDLGMLLVPPFEHLQKVRNQFVKAEIAVLTLDAPSLCHFLKSLPSFYLPCPLKEAPIKSSSECSNLLNFCLRGQVLEDVSCVEGLPLLVTRDKMLQCFSQQKPVYQSSSYHLFPQHQDCFSACQINDVKAKEGLIKTGFLKEFTLSESVNYIQEMLIRDEWITATDEGQKWLKELWKFFERQVCKFKDEDTNQMFEKLVDLFRGYKLLPVSGCNKLLVSFETLHTVMPDDSRDISDILCKLGFLKIDSSLLPQKLTSSCIQPRLLKSKDPAVVLVQLATHGSLCWDKLKPWEMSRLTWFLCEDLKVLQCDHQLIGKLKSLPVFENTQGKYVPLTPYENVYRLQSKISDESKNLKELYEVDRKTVLLKDNCLHQHLSACLGIDVMNDLQQFMHQLLPRLPSLPEAHVLEAVKLLLTIKNLYYGEYQKVKEKVVLHFQSFPFIRDHQNELQPVSYFYDEHKSLFQTLGLASRFVPDKFYMSVGPGNKGAVEQFLLDVGLQTKLTKEDFLMCVARIQEEALRDGAMSGDLPQRRELLLEHLLSWPDEALSDDFLKKVSRIHFLVPQSVPEDLRHLHHPYAPHDYPVAPQGSVYLAYKVELIWTSAVIFPFCKYLDKKRESILKLLGVLCTVPAQLVLKNLSNVCQAPCNDLKARKTRAQVLTSIYKYLSEQKEIETGCLKGLPVVLVDDDEVAEAQNVVVSLKMAVFFRPYLYKLPPKLAVYEDLLERFGVQEEPSIHHFASVLARIHDETIIKGTLHPNLTKTLCRATQFLFQLLDEAQKPVDFSELKELYLPCTDGKLYPSNTLVFSFCKFVQNSKALQSTFHFLEDLSVCHLVHDRYKQWKLLQLLPEALRPRNLLDIIEEQLDKSSLKLCPYGEHCELQNCLKELLVSSEFRYALVALLKSQNKKKVEGRDEVECMCDGLFSPQHLEVVCCKKLCTVMVHNSQSLEGTQCDKVVHVAKMTQGKQQIYLAHQERDNVAMVTILAGEINNCIGRRLGNDALLVLVQILACQEPQEIVAVLQRNKVPVYQPPNQNAYNLPSPGEDVPEEWYDSLDMNILHTFLPGDYVGYLVSSQPREHYVYAVILEALGPRQSGAGQVHIYRVDLGEGQEAEVSTYDLYHFQRTSPASDLNKAVVLAESSPGAPSSTNFGTSGDWYQRPLHEVKKELDIHLAEIWSLSEEEKKKALRRLYLCYHPDKNLGHETSANEIFKYLKESIMKMQEGEQNSSSRRHKGNSSYNSNFQNFSESWAEWDGQAHWHHQKREEFTRQTRGGRGGQPFRYNFWSFHQSAPNRSGNRSTRGCPKEAPRWLRQAECDLQGAASEAGSSSPEWLLYKTYRAVEKALTAVVYHQGGHFDKKRSLEMLANEVASYGEALATLPDQVAELQEHGMDDKATQYPLYHNFPTIPNEAFPKCKEQAVLLLAREILNTVKRWLAQS
ncbi:sacsin-like isoform X1 [Varanus komodoensis]|nr:sacsin-like isoform X1 [Varanus komodoensis]